VSLADLSKWGVNNVGMFLSDRKVQNNNDYALTFVPQITAAGNAPLMENQGWEKICGNYIASGKEEYFIIGCFGEEAALQMEKNKKPANIEGNVIPEAYYYLDKIEVNEIDDPSACYCGKAEDKEAALIFSRARDLSADPKAEEVIAKTTVWFAYLLTEVPAMFDEDLASVVKAMQDNSTMRIQISGHCDDDEFAQAKIQSEYAGMGLMRANAIKDYLVDKGIESSRIMIESKDNNSPGSTMKTPLGKAQNRRVTFSVL
ncbi:MAG: OmpA family protein, partial [Flavobacteriales bacterium]